MTRFGLALMAVLVMAPLTQNALALSVDDSNAVTARAALAGDPDDKIPYPHVGDDGQSAVAHFQAPPAGNTGMSLSITPSGNGSDQAFQRAQERMQQ